MRYTLDESASLDEIIARTVALRKLQQEIRGVDTSDGAEATPSYWTIYRYGTRQGRRR